MKFDEIKQKSKDVLDSFFDIEGEAFYGIKSSDTELLSTALAESLSGVTKQ
jgi:hypothetical protein